MNELTKSIELFKNDEWQLKFDIQLGKTSSLKDTSGFRSCCVSFPKNIFTALYYELYFFPQNVPVMKLYTINADWLIDLFMKYQLRFMKNSFTG